MNVLAELLSSRVKAEIFRLLFGHDNAELHVREIARRAGLNDATVRQELIRLTRAGVVVARKDGNRMCYRASTEHPLYPDIRGLVDKTSGLTAVLGEALRSLDVDVAFVFGSLASGKEKPVSDVDLMVIGSLTLRDLSKHLLRIAARLGREVNPHILTVEEFVQRRKAKDHFLSTILRAPKLFVIGDERELERLGK